MSKKPEFADLFFSKTKDFLDIFFKKPGTAERRYDKGLPNLAVFLL